MYLSTLPNLNYLLKDVSWGRNSVVCLHIIYLTNLHCISRWHSPHILKSSMQFHGIYAILPMLSPPSSLPWKQKLQLHSMDMWSIGLGRWTCTSFFMSSTRGAHLNMYKLAYGRTLSCSYIAIIGHYTQNLHITLRTTYYLQKYIQILDSNWVLQIPYLHVGIQISSFKWRNTQSRRRICSILELWVMEFEHVGRPPHHFLT